MNAKRPKIPLEKLEKSTFERVISFLSMLIFLGSLAFLALVWGDIPDRVPAHFNFSGEVTRHGSQWELLILPIIGLVIYLSMHLLEKYPHMHNYPIEITESNAEEAYKISRSMLGMLKNTILVIFSFIMINASVIALGWGDGVASLILPLVFLGTGLPIIIAIVKLVKLSLRDGT
ncbi:DUF1648 domain-containing protein [Evansella cellulosilytica]|uniref:DUF1648 domain-containing protein n=1 Tax=Evansella cellulosilytica (strain ATCC 21833 / DSM 2522 / FERM P-1141 / JCM 9156 / N-4) TaxID=649639 RepID=E6TWH2_EVAC2|nr:DUF1648 domain-containing protein [Evansella cellulosilytica]ADU32235.1 protein of unknown function DUF1648 [Evansella cellulosilytica DSM 2522]